VDFTEGVNYDTPQYKRSKAMKTRSFHGFGGFKTAYMLEVVEVAGVKIEQNLTIEVI
jgi:hypothetical protein